jgi:hypothetical protein
MSIRKRSDVEAALSQKGFVLREADHRYYLFYLEGRLAARTKVSTGTKYKDLRDDLLKKMAKQCHLTTQQFLNLVDCPMSAEQYKEIVVSQKKTAPKQG